MNGEECVTGIYNYCTANLSSLEIWPDFYKIRFEEFTRFQKLFPEKKFKDVLEIGCGLGYQSAFLSCISDRVIASDIDSGNMVKHSRGLEATHNFIKKLPVNNIEILNANAESLPFEDESFDFIYCSFSFQYIPDKPKALAEIKRVMKKEGYFFCILPTTAYQLINAKKYYLSVLKKIFKGNKKKIIGKEKVYNEGTFIKRRQNKLFPPSDDESNSFISELFAYSTLRWRNLFKKNNHSILLEKSDATSVIFLTKKTGNGI